MVLYHLNIFDEFLLFMLVDEVIDVFLELVDVFDIELFLDFPLSLW